MATEEVRFTKNTALLYDLTRNRPHLTYVKLDKSILDKNILYIPHVSPVVDTSLPTQNQLSKVDFLNLPKQYQKGHMISWLFFSHDEQLLKKVDKYSHCAVQHGSLNDGLWSKLEEFARTSAALGNVRVVVITEGYVNIFLVFLLNHSFLIISINASCIVNTVTVILRKNWRPGAFPLNFSICF